MSNIKSHFGRSFVEDTAIRSLDSRNTHLRNVPTANQREKQKAACCAAPLEGFSDPLLGKGFIDSRAKGDV